MRPAFQARWATRRTPVEAGVQIAPRPGNLQNVILATGAAAQWGGWLGRLAKAGLRISPAGRCCESPSAPDPWDGVISTFSCRTRPPIGAFLGFRIPSHSSVGVRRHGANPIPMISNGSPAFQRQLFFVMATALEVRVATGRPLPVSVIQVTWRPEICRMPVLATDAAAQWVAG